MDKVKLISEPEELRVFFASCHLIPHEQVPGLIIIHGLDGFCGDEVERTLALLDDGRFHLSKRNKGLKIVATAKHDKIGGVSCNFEESHRMGPVSEKK